MEKEASIARAKLFMNGRSQAVRLPKEFRFRGDEVSIRKEGDRVILEPRKRPTWPQGYWMRWSKVPDDFQAPEPLPSKPLSMDLEG